jgi:hypothetical protein
MAAFCGCCGAEITAKVEACPVCKTPQHGMWPGEPPELPGIRTAASEKSEEPGEE